MNNLIIEHGIFTNDTVSISVDEFKELVGRFEITKKLAKYYHSNKYTAMSDEKCKVLLDILDLEVADNE